MIDSIKCDSVKFDSIKFSGIKFDPDSKLDDYY